MAAALAERPDTSWVYLLSGGTEISRNTQARSTGDRDALLLAKLPRTRRVTSVSAHSLLRAFTSPTDWAGLHWLSDNQAAAPRPDPPVAEDGPIELDTGDETLLEALARDGRMGYAELATITGWSDSTRHLQIPGPRTEDRPDQLQGHRERRHPHAGRHLTIATTA